MGEEVMVATPVMLVILVTLAMRVMEVKGAIFMITMDMDMEDTVRWRSQEKWTE